MLPMLGTEPCLFHAVGSLFSDSLKNIHINTKAPLKGIIQLNLLYGFFFLCWETVMKFVVLVETT